MLNDLTDDSLEHSKSSLNVTDKTQNQNIHTIICDIACTPSILFELCDL